MGWFEGRVEVRGALARLHLACGGLALLFLGAALVRAASHGFTVSPELYERVRYRPGPAAETVLNAWRGQGLDPASRTVAIWGLADADENELDASSPGLAVALRLAAAGAAVRVHDPRFADAARARYGAELTLFDDPYEAARGATELVRNSDHAEYDTPDFDRLGAAMPDGVLFDCLERWDARESGAARLRTVRVGGPGWPPWLDPEFRQFVDDVRERVARDEGILLLPSARLASPSPRARWYLLLNYHLAPRPLFLADSELASGTAPQFQQWVRERNRSGPPQDADVRAALEETGARWILWFRQSPDFRSQDWRLEEARP